MRYAALIVTAVLLLPSAIAAQSSAPAGQKAGKHSEPITLAGCVSPKPAGSNFTFTAKDGAKYRLSGKNIGKYAGQEVEIVGGEGKKLTIKGGLLPSPNAAAQAGAIDPGQAIIESLPGGAQTGTGAVELPQFNVTRVRGLGGACQ